MPNGDVTVIPVDPYSLIIDIGAAILERIFHFPTFNPFDPNTWFDPNVWFGFGRGLPDNVKTLQTAHRLSLSTVPLVVALGLHFAELAGQEKILSRPSDVADFFGPAMDYTTTMLRPDLPHGTLSLDNVVFGGAHIAQFDNHYFDLRPKFPHLVSPQEFAQLRPGKKFPTRFYQHVKNLWPKLSHCPPGTTYNPQTEKCEAKPPLVCLPGYTLINGLCVYGPKPSGPACACGPPRRTP